MAWGLSLLAAGWLAYDATQSPFFVAVVHAARFAPLALAGFPAGAISDRYGRRRVLTAASWLSAALAGLLLIANHANGGAGPLLLVCIGWGVADAARLVAGANLAYDLAGPGGTTRALALTSLVSGVGQIASGLLGGPVIQAFGPSWAIGAIVLFYVISVVPLGRVTGAHLDDTTTALPRWRDLAEGVSLVRRNPLIATLVVIGVVAEMTAFSAMALDPVFAVAVFGAGPIGLGMITAARSAGRFAGSLALAGLSHRFTLGPTLAWSVAVFGAALVGYSGAVSLLMAASMLVLAGAAGAFVDVLEQTAIQAAAGRHARGRAAGLWVISLGFGPVGVLEIGVLAEFWGARAAQAVNGGLMLVFGMLLVTSAVGRRLRPLQSDDSGVLPAGVDTSDRRS